MNLDKVMEVTLLIYDTLRNDDESKGTIDLLDSAESNDDFKKGFQLAVERLKIVNPYVARTVMEKTKGFAF